MTTVGDRAFLEWSRGYGVIQHTPETCERIQALVNRLAETGAQSEGQCYAILSATDRLASAAMWVVAHMTYANRVDLSGAALFQRRPLRQRQRDIRAAL